MDFTIELAEAWIALAEKVGGQATLDSGSVLAITLPYFEGIGERADTVAAGITNEDFPWGYVIPANDNTLILEA